MAATQHFELTLMHSLKYREAPKREISQWQSAKGKYDLALGDEPLAFRATQKTLEDVRAMLRKKYQHAHPHEIDAVITTIDNFVDVLTRLKNRWKEVIVPESYIEMQSVVESAVGLIWVGRLLMKLLNLRLTSSRWQEPL